MRVSMTGRHTFAPPRAQRAMSIKLRELIRSIRACKTAAEETDFRPFRFAVRLSSVSV